MTPAQLRKMNKARAAATQRRHKAERRQLSAYRQWLRDEALAWSRYSELREFHGPWDSDTVIAHRNWQNIMRQMPPVPSDSAWKRERGETDSD